MEKKLERKAKEVLRQNTTAIIEVILIGNFTSIIDLCEEKDLITMDAKTSLTSSYTNKTEKERVSELLNILRRSLGFGTSEIINEFLCIIRDECGRKGEALSKQMATEYGYPLKGFPQGFLDATTSNTTTPSIGATPSMETTSFGEVTRTTYTVPQQEQTDQYQSLEDNDASEKSNESIINKVDSDLPGFGSTTPVKVYSNKHRGLVLIICNERFRDQPDIQRKGADEDIGNITKTFVDLKYQVKAKKNMTAPDIKDFFGNLDAELSGQDIDCFICFFSSHGSHLGIQCTDGEYVSVQKLAGYLHADKCPSLKGKPKLFFIQACRGSGLPNVVQGDDCTNPANETVSDGNSITAIPPGADFFFGYSTISDNQALRGTCIGSHYILVLCKMVAKYAGKHTLHDIVMIVHEELATNNDYSLIKRDGNTYRQMAEMVSTLRKNFYFKC